MRGRWRTGQTGREEQRRGVGENLSAGAVANGVRKLKLRLAVATDRNRRRRYHDAIVLRSEVHNHVAGKPSSMGRKVRVPRAV